MSYFAFLLIFNQFNNFNGYLWASVLCLLSFVPLCKTGPKDVWSIFKPYRLNSKFSLKKIVNKNLTNL